jgi:hypothetical protein
VAGGGDLWWFGFDAAHAGDDEDGGRSLGYMVEECESLARQLNTRVIWADNGFSRERYADELPERDFYEGDSPDY